MNADQRSDEDLMIAYQLGEESAFGLLYARHSGRVYAYLLGRLNQEAAKDVFQSVFLKLHRTRNNYDRKVPVAAWLFTITRSAMLDAKRKQARLKEDPIEIDNLAQSEQFNFKTVTADLEGKQRNVVELRYVEGLDFDEIATRLETSPSNIRQILSRAIRKLRTSFSGGGVNE